MKGSPLGERRLRSPGGGAAPRCATDREIPFASAEIALAAGLLATTTEGRGVWTEGRGFGTEGTVCELEVHASRTPKPWGFSTAAARGRPVGALPLPRGGFTSGRLAPWARSPANGS